MESGFSTLRSKKVCGALTISSSSSLIPSSATSPNTSRTWCRSYSLIPPLPASKQPERVHGAHGEEGEQDELAWRRRGTGRGGVTMRLYASGASPFLKKRACDTQTLTYFERTHIHLFTHIYTYTHPPTYLYTHKYTYAQTHAHTHAHTHMQAYTHTHTHTSSSSEF
jgi:hypothetical protein